MVLMLANWAWPAGMVRERLPPSSPKLPLSRLSSALNLRLFLSCPKRPSRYPPQAVIERRARARVVVMGREWCLVNIRLFSQKWLMPWCLLEELCVLHLILLSAFWSRLRTADTQIAYATVCWGIRLRPITIHGPMSRDPPRPILVILPANKGEIGRLIPSPPRHRHDVIDLQHPWSLLLQQKPHPLCYFSRILLKIANRDRLSRIGQTLRVVHLGTKIAPYFGRT